MTRTYWRCPSSDSAIKLEDETRAYSTFLVTGPRSRDLLMALSDNDFGNNAFPWLTTICERRQGGYDGFACLTGEMGWELHLPVTETEAVYSALRAAGRM